MGSERRLTPRVGYSTLASTACYASRALSDKAPKGNQFGTFGGVFTPSILTILGVIMFMRAGFVTGQAGILGAIVILCIAKAITFFTGLSIAAISTNAPVKGGGAYFLISRSLGQESGGAIGLTLYLAQAFSVPFYILGFCEALVASFPELSPYFMVLTFATACALFVINLFGAGWALKVQYLILAVLVLAMIAFLGGAIAGWEAETFQSNWKPDYTEGHNFWIIFAIYFPAVTGIMAGVNMSGDLKDPSRSIPSGTLAAIAVGFLVYLLEAILCGGALAREDLIARPYESLLELALFNAGFLVVAGVFAATLSSAMGSFMGAPRILQALSRDDIFRRLRPFAVGSARGDEPIRGLMLTFVITLLVLGFAGNSAGGGALNLVASILTMFFLYTYGITNIACFLETIARNPSFRPRFRFFHWTSALIGAFGCIAAAFLIDWISALVALAVIVGLYYYVSRSVLSSTFGDVRRGFYYSRVRENLLRLASAPPDPKNWRPTTLVLTGNPHTRLALTQYAVWLESGRGVVTLAEVVIGSVHTMHAARDEALKRLKTFIDDNELAAFPEVVLASDFDTGLAGMLQCHSIGPLKPNLVMLGWSRNLDTAEAYVNHLALAKELGISILLTRDTGLPDLERDKRIDIWWRGRANGSLMVLLAYMLKLNHGWRSARLRILRLVGEGAERGAAETELRGLVGAARIDAEIEVLVSHTSFPDILHEQSADATLVLMGFAVPEPGQAESFLRSYNQLIDGLPTTMLISSNGQADLLA